MFSEGKISKHLSRPEETVIWVVFAFNPHSQKKEFYDMGNPDWESRRQKSSPAFSPNGSCDFRQRINAFELQSPCFRNFSLAAVSRSVFQERSKVRLLRKHQVSEGQVCSPLPIFNRVHLPLRLALDRPFGSSESAQKVLAMHCKNTRSLYLWWYKQDTF